MQSFRNKYVAGPLALLVDLVAGVTPDLVRAAARISL